MIDFLSEIIAKCLKEERIYEGDGRAGFIRKIKTLAA